MNRFSQLILPLLRRWPVAFAVTILAATGVLKWHGSLMPENTYIPMPIGPTPNARDYFLQSAALLKVDAGWAESTPEKPPKGTSAAEIADVKSEYHVYTLAEKDAIVRKNHPAIVKLEQGLAYPYFAVQARSFSALFPYYAKDRDLARNLQLAARTSKAHGKWNQAMTYNLDAIKMGEDLPHGATIIGMLVGNACEAIGRKTADSLIDNLTAQESIVAAKRLEKIDSDRAPASETLKEEKWTTQGGLLEIFKSQKWGHTMLDMFEYTADDHIDVETQLRFALDSPRIAFDSYTTYADRYIAISEKPWPEQISTVRPTVPKEPLSALLLPVFDQAILRVYYAETLDRLLEAQLALHAYRLTHGSYPASLQSIAPNYISAVPLDPFTNSEPLKYRAVGTSYILYSVGPDATDDGGVPMVEIREGTKSYVLSGEQEKGDIVAGINR